MRGLSIAVAGCGPCGLAAALLLSRRGHRVTLFERFVEPKPIGSGLMIQPTGQAVLAELGLLPRVLAEGARIERLTGHAGARKVLDVHYRWLGGGSRFGIGVHRSSLFDALYDAVRAEGIALRSGTEIVSSEAGGDGRRLVLAGGERSEAFDLVVDALGTRSTLAPECGRTLRYGALWATLDWPDGAGFPDDRVGAFPDDRSDERFPGQSW